MRASRLGLIAAIAGATLIAGCKKTTDNTVNYKIAINTYYASRPACLWPDSIKFPAQVNTSDDSKTAGYDALVDQGLLTRTTAEKKVFILGSHQVTNYDLSAKGHSTWTPDPQQPGFGNYCYGTPKVTSIDSSTPTTSQPGATTTVTYHVGITGAPGWATAAETQTAFPQVAATLTPVAATATLTDTTNGWAVTQGPAGNSHPATATDGAVVQ
jgi:hypothetical protein